MPLHQPLPCSPFLVLSLSAAPIVRAGRGSHIACHTRSIGCHRGWMLHCHYQTIWSWTMTEQNQYKFAHSWQRPTYLDETSCSQLLLILLCICSRSIRPMNHSAHKYMNKWKTLPFSLQVHIYIKFIGRFECQCMRSNGCSPANAQTCVAITALSYAILWDM